MLLSREDDRWTLNTAWKVYVFHDCNNSKTPNPNNHVCVEDKSEIITIRKLSAALLSTEGGNRAVTGEKPRGSLP